MNGELPLSEEERGIPKDTLFFFFSIFFSVVVFSVAIWLRHLAFFNVSFTKADSLTVVCRSMFLCFFHQSCFPLLVKTEHVGTSPLQVFKT